MSTETTLYDKLKDFLYTCDDGKYIKQIKDYEAGERQNFELSASDLLNLNIELYEDLINNPDNKEGVFQTLKNILKEIAGEEVPLRVRDLIEVKKIRELTAEDRNKIVEIRGIAIRVSEIKNLLLTGVFRCEKCGHIIIIHEDKNREKGLKFSKPVICENPACGGKGPFTLLEDESEFLDWQSVKIQEIPEELGNRVNPRSIDVIIEGRDLIDIIKSGDRVHITGILRHRQEKIGPSLSRSYKRYLVCLGIKKQEEEDIEITERDIKKIKELSRDPFIVERISDSVFPFIKGYEDIKKAVCFQMFGGTPIELEDGTVLRENIHILLAGDPAIAKTRILQTIAKTVPRAIYSSGKGISAAGLTAAVVKDDLSGDWVLEAGILVLANGSLACIDEIDKMRKEDRSALHEAMESMKISIAKAGIISTLPANTSILASGNPQYGRFDRNKPLIPQIDLPPSLLSRFDLIFVILDEPNKQKDRTIAEHLLKIRGTHQIPSSETTRIDRELLKKYIYYAKRNYLPTLSDKAQKKLTDFYTSLRNLAYDDSAIPITPRQVEAMCRLCEARAKMRLKKEADEKDAEDVISLFKSYLYRFGIDIETGKLDIDVIMTGKPKSQRDKMIRVIDIISELEGDNGASLSRVIEECENVGIDKNFVKRAIEEFKQRGDLYEPTPNKFKVLR